MTAVTMKYHYPLRIYISQNFAVNPVKCLLNVRKKGKFMYDSYEKKKTSLDTWTFWFDKPLNAKVVFRQSLQCQQCQGRWSNWTGYLDLEL